MQAGRELDKRIAVELGWSVDPRGPIYRKEKLWFDIRGRRIRMHSFQF